MAEEMKRPSLNPKKELKDLILEGLRSPPDKIADSSYFQKLKKLVKKTS